MKNIINMMNMLLLIPPVIFSGSDRKLEPVTPATDDSVITMQKYNKILVYFLTCFCLILSRDQKQVKK